MNSILLPLADIEDIPVKGIIIVIGLIIWGVSALAKAAKQGIDQQKERMRQVREQMARDQQGPPRARPPVQLAPEIAMRVPPQVRPTQKQQRKSPPPRRATNYNAMGQIPKRRIAPPPIPTLQLEQEETHTLMPIEPVSSVTPTAKSSVRRSTSVGAPAIHSWLTPSKLRQQFILTEIFQPPLALRDPESGQRI